MDFLALILVVLFLLACASGLSVALRPYFPKVSVFNLAAYLFCAALIIFVLAVGWLIWVGSHVGV
jgi:hypothetical protein